MTKKEIVRNYGLQTSYRKKVKYTFFFLITAKAAFKFGSVVWVLKKREEQRLEAAQMKFLRHLFGITKLDKDMDQCILGKRLEHKT